MATISIVKRHHLTHKKACEVAEKVAQDLQQRFALDYVWNGDEIDFERPGCKGRLLVKDDQFKLDVSLGFFLSALKSAIEQEIVSQFDKLVDPKAADSPKGAKKPPATKTSTPRKKT